MTEAVTLEVCENGLAVVTIDRPKALNAASVKMCQDLRAILDQIKGRQEEVKAVLLQGAGERPCFCSGGDVKALHGFLTADPSTAVPKDQMRQEYNAIAQLSALPQPTVALMNGITMGFGIGLGAIARYGVATEKSRLAMPENNIGLFPDAGFAYLAANKLAPGVGRLMALTGCHLIGAGDVLAAKLATHYVPLEDLPKLVEEDLKKANLRENADAAIKACLDGRCKAAPERTLLNDDLLDKFAKLTAAADARKMLDDMKAADLLKELDKGSPFCQAVVFKLLTLAEAECLADSARLSTALERDFATACRVMYRPDFVEGLRAVLVDKGQNGPPKWAAFNEADVEAAIVALPMGEGLF